MKKKGPHKKKSKKKMCRNKVCYKDGAKANMAVHALKNKYKFSFFIKIRSYKCPFCEQWHVGHYK